MVKLNIFILEDSESRIEYFKKHFDNHNLTIYERIDDTVYECLKQQKFDMLFLDHDLESHLLRKNSSKTGYDLAYYLVLSNLQSQAIIYVHSMNPIGANNIVRLLNKANYEVQWLPFHLLKQCGGFNENKS